MRVLDGNLVSFSASDEPLHQFSRLQLTMGKSGWELGSGGEVMVIALESIPPELAYFLLKRKQGYLSATAELGRHYDRNGDITQQVQNCVLNKSIFCAASTCYH